MIVSAAVTAGVATSLGLCLDEFLERFHNAGPAAAVIFAGNGFLGQTAVRDLNAGAVFGRRQLPAHDCAAGFVVVPISDPRVGQQARRIEFEHFALAKELAYSVDVQIGLLSSEAPLPSGACIHLKKFGGTLFAVPPANHLLGIDERLKHALGRSGNFDFADNRVLLRSGVIRVVATGVSLELFC
jgi:hypothetical protein